MNKPIKPNITIPESFAINGIKTDFDSNLISEGFDYLKPDVLAGDNLNKFIDDTYQGLNYGMAAADAINLINEGETLTVVDGKLTSGIIGSSGFNLFDTKISDHLLEGETAKGWVLQGTYVSGAIYPDFYAKCLEEYNEANDTETVNGVLVKVHSNGHKFYNIADKIGIDNFFDSVGFAWFYGIDTENERIFLPRDKYFAVKGIAPVVGNGMTLGLTDGSLNLGVYTSSASSGLRPVTGAYGLATGASVIASTEGEQSLQKALGITTNPTKSGVEAHLETCEDKYLYICVGNIIVNESEIDVSNVLSELQYKADIENDVNSLKNYICDINFTCASKANWVITNTNVNRGSFSIGADNITIARSGLYMFSCWATHPTNANGTDLFTICVNGMEQYRMINDAICDSSCVGLLNLSEGDIVQGISVLAVWGNETHPARFILQRLCDKY